MNTFVLALAFAFIIEGLFPALFPNKWQAYVKKLSEEHTTTIRKMGTGIILVGCVLLWGVN